MKNIHTMPAFQSNGELPPGEHITTLLEIEEKLGSSTRQRKKLMAGLKKVIDGLAAAGVKKVWINGSFITNKTEPGDIDGCWEWTEDIDQDLLDPLFLNRFALKETYGVDFFIAGVIEGGSGKPFSEFFQTNRDGEPKGILIINIGG